MVLRGCLVSVICNSNSNHSFIFKLCIIMIVHTLKMDVHLLCYAHFMKLFHFLFIFFYFFLGGGGLERDGFWFVLSVTPKVFIPQYSNFA